MTNNTYDFNWLDAYSFLANVPYQFSQVNEDYVGIVGSSIYYNEPIKVPKRKNKVTTKIDIAA